MNEEILRAKYNPDGSNLRKIQLRMLDILTCVDSICRKHNIRYWLSSGTLLGSVRHGGFIPWDDDLDIEMLRKDYQKLLKVLPEELPGNYVLQTHDTDSNYVYQYAKIRDLNSFIYDTCETNRIFRYQGIFIDIFPLEPSFNCLTKIAAVVFNRLCFCLALKKGILHRLYKWNYWICTSLLFPIFRCISKLAPSKIVGNTFGVGFFEKRNLNFIFPLKEIKFEGRYFYAPFDTDYYLKRHYGNYMKIPDVINKEIHVVDEKTAIW